MTNQEFVVLMTACIAPEAGIRNKPGSRVRRVDPAIRLKDYTAALKYWLQHPDARIRAVVFADNSGYDLQELAASVARAGFKRKVEFLSLSRCEWPEHVHYGYCELQIIDEALSLSTLLDGAQYFLKATGRLQFTGVARLLDRLPNDFLFAVDCRWLKMPFRAESRDVMTQLMIFSTSFYRAKLLGINARLEPWVVSHIEQLLFVELTKYYGVDGAMLRWPVNVGIVGHSATTNDDYSSIKLRTKQAIRAVIRRIVPGIWI